MAKANPKKQTEKDENEVVDPFAYLFAGYDGTASKAKLIRVEPEDWQGVSIKGYVCDIDPSMDESWIKANHGGGKYQLMKIGIASGRIEAARYMDISGNPLVATSLPLSPAGGAPALFEPVEIDIDGSKVPYNGNLNEITKFVITMKSIAQAFPPRQDINDTLLTLLLAKSDSGSGDILEQITKIKAASDLFGGKENTGAGVADLLNNAISQAGGIIQNMTAGPKAIAGPMARPVAGNKQVKKSVSAVVNGGTADTVDTEIQPGADGVPDNENPQQEVAMSQQEVLFAVSRQLVTNFRLEVPIPPDRTVRMVDQILRQEDHNTRKMLKDSYGDIVKDFAAGELGEDWSDPESKVGSRDDFDKWCDEIWSIYADAKRQVVLL